MIERIKTLIAGTELSQTAFLQEIGLPASAITEWSKGKAKPSLSAIVKIADYFNVSVDYLIGRKGNGDVVMQDTVNISAISEVKKFIIGYVDILGTKKALEKRGDEEVVKIFSKIYKIFEETIKLYNSITSYGKVNTTIFSDNIVVAVEYEESKKSELLNFMITFLSLFQYEVMKQAKLFLRGSIVIGDLQINDLYILGSGLVNAYRIESKEVSVPFIAIERSIFDSFPQMNELYVQVLNHKYYFIDFLAVIDKAMQHALGIEFNTEDIVLYFCEIVKDNIQQNISDYIITKKSESLYKYLYNYAASRKIDVPSVDEVFKITTPNEQYSVKGVLPLDEALKVFGEQKVAAEEQLSAEGIHKDDVDISGMD